MGDASIYFVENGRTFWRKPSREPGLVNDIPLANFAATIVADTCRDDGAEVSREYEIEVALVGNGRQTIRVQTPAFKRMDWVAECGSKAIIMAGFGAQDRLREAILQLSHARQALVYTHSGWRTISGSPIYLHSGGGIGAAGLVPGVTTALPPSLAALSLPKPSADAAVVREAVRASLDVLKLAPLHVTAPVLAAVYRAALGHAPFSVGLVGRTGVFKTELALLALRHFGRGFDDKHLPASWSDTQNALTELCFLCKDALLLIDDYKPGGSAVDRAKLNLKVDAVLRGQANAAGRQRMRADTTLRPYRKPRGLVLWTGEEVPVGESLGARCFVVSISPGEIEAAKLTACQSDAANGRYEQALASYLQWIAGRHEAVLAKREEIFRDRREIAFRGEQHRRTATNAAELFAGLSIFFDFAAENGVIAEAERDSLAGEVWEALLACADDQTRIQREEEPSGRFLSLLTAALSSGCAHIATADETSSSNPTALGWQSDGHGVWRRPGFCVGWLRNDEVFLNPVTAYRAALQMADSTGIPVSERTLKRALRDAGKLIRTDEKRNMLTIRKTFDGKVQEVLALRSSDIGLVTTVGPTAGTIEVHSVDN